MPLVTDDGFSECRDGIVNALRGTVLNVFEAP